MASKPDFSEKAIVIVDDMPMFAECVKTFLHFQLYSEVETFDCPRKALDEIRERGCPAYIITDFEMPAMTGAELLKAVTLEYPQVKGVIMTCHHALPAEVTGRFGVIRKDTPDFFDTLLNHLRKELYTIA